MLDHGLTPNQCETIRLILSPYAETITRVDLFGSRAKGSYRANSDIDIVLHGVGDDKIISRLWTLFADSNLPYKVDIKSYELTTYAALKAHMDEVGQTLFIQADLLKSE